VLIRCTAGLQVCAWVCSGILLAFVANVWQTLSVQASALSAVRMQLIFIILLAITVFCCCLLANMATFGPHAPKMPSKPALTKTPASVASNVTVHDSFLSPIGPVQSTEKMSEWLKTVESQPRHEVVKKLFGDAPLEPELLAVSQPVAPTPPVSRPASAKPPQASATPSPVEDIVATACRLVDTIPVDGRITPDTLACVTDAIAAFPNNAEVWCSCRPVFLSPLCVHGVFCWYQQLLWRRARLRYLQSKHDASNTEWLLQSGVTDALAAVHADTTNANTHKWYAILLSSLNESADVKTKLSNGFLIREHAHTAARLNPSDSAVHFLLGRWCFAVAGGF
jgi:hypothetical protein